MFLYKQPTFLALEHDASENVFFSRENHNNSTLHHERENGMCRMLVSALEMFALQISNFTRMFSG